MYQSGSQQEKNLFGSDGSLEDILTKGVPTKVHRVKGNSRREGATEGHKRVRSVTTPDLQGQEGERGRVHWGLEHLRWAWSEEVQVGGDAATAKPRGCKDERL